MGGGTFHGGGHINRGGTFQGDDIFPWGVDFGPYLVDAQQGGGGIYGGIKQRSRRFEPGSAPTLLRAFFKGKVKIFSG